MKITKIKEFHLSIHYESLRWVKSVFSLIGPNPQWHRRSPSGRSLPNRRRWIDLDKSGLANDAILALTDKTLQFLHPKSFLPHLFLFRDKRYYQLLNLTDLKLKTGTKSTMRLTGLKV